MFRILLHGFSCCISVQ